MDWYLGYLPSVKVSTEKSVTVWTNFILTCSDSLLQFYLIPEFFSFKVECVYQYLKTFY